MPKRRTPAVQQKYSVPVPADSLRELGIVVIEPAVSEANDKCEPDLSGFAAAMRWLMNRGVTSRNIGFLFGTTGRNVRQILWRYSRRKTAIVPCLIEPVLSGRTFLPVPAALRKMLGIRPHEDSVVLDRGAKQRLQKIEEELDKASAAFWTGVRYGAGLRRLTTVEEQFGYSSHHARIRLFARLHQLICETNLHWGRSASAINEGLKSLYLYKVANDESGWKSDFESLGRSARLVSQAYLLRREPLTARLFLDVHKKACEAAGAAIRPEYYHQLAIAAFQEESNPEAAQKNLQTAMEQLSETEDYGVPKQEHEVFDIGQRPLNLIRGDWDSSSSLLDYMVRHYLPDDIHISINASWTAACGFATDDLRVHADACGLLDQYAAAAKGYGRQATIIELLRLTIHLPLALRRDWARHVLYENAFADR